MCGGGVVKDVGNWVWSFLEIVFVFCVGGFVG